MEKLSWMFREMAAYFYFGFPFRKHTLLLISLVPPGSGKKGLEAPFIWENLSRVTLRSENKTLEPFSQVKVAPPVIFLSHLPSLNLLHLNKLIFTL